jgi:hypothetical protein
VSSRSLPSVCPAPGAAWRRLPSSGSRGPHFPTFTGTMRRSDCHTAPLAALRLSLAPPIPCLLLCVRGVPCGLVVGSKLPGRARAFGHPVPQSGNVARRQVALPSSRATPMETCPARRPRWGPGRSPCRVPDCSLPATGNRRLSPPYRLEGYPTVHHYTLFGALSRGLPPRSLQLRTPSAGLARGVPYRCAGSALIGWDLNRIGSHPLGNDNQFHGISPHSKVSGLPWRDQRVVRPR